MAFSLPALPYAFNALEPQIDAKTMEIHHGKHHQAYINNANAALENTEYSSWTPEKVLASLGSLPVDKQNVLRNNVGGHLNHSLFWTILGPSGKNVQPAGKLHAALDELGGFQTFKTDLSKAAMGRFGSGWAWLGVDKSKKLKILSTANQDSPLLEGVTPILGIDVWEHAYYLNYQNRRADYVEAFFSVINWGRVAELYEEAVK